MPRTCSPTERSTISGAGVNHLLKLQVADADGTMQDCSALGTLGLDLLDAVTWTVALDTPVSTGTLTIRRDTNDDTAAPTMGASSINRNAAHTYAPLFEKGRAVLVSTATVASGATPVSGDWKPMLTGRIDAVHWQSNPMTIDVSDIGAWVVDAFIQAPKQYITPAAPGAGPLLGDVLQAMVNDTTNAPVKTAPITIYQPVTAPFQPYAKDPTQPTSLFAAMRALAQEIGWELRYRYDASDVFRLTLYEPDRANTTADWTIGPSEYRNVTRLETSIADIRNVIKGYYNVLAIANQSVTSSDASSIAKYGTRFMQVSSSLITNATDMRALTDAILSDLSEAPADQEIEMPYFWPVQIGDLITFQANGDHYDSDQTLAVVGYTHTLQGGEGSTTIRARGKVAGAYRTWLRRQVELPVVNADDPERSILRIVPSESTDGTQRLFAVTVGSLVDTVHVHYRLVPLGALGDVFDFSGDEDTTISPSLLILRRSAGSDTVSFSIPHPARGFYVAARLIPRTASPDFFDGASWPVQIDPAPQAVNAKIHPLRNGTTADLSIDIAFGVSDGPTVTVDVVEDAGAASTTILTTTLSAPATIDKISNAVLGGRVLPPGNDVLAWRVRITDSAGQAYWFGPALARRDPLPIGTPTVLNYRATPAIVCPFNPDTSQIRYTAHSGKVKTFSSGVLAASGSPVTYTVGDAFDDATTETALVVDETRTAAKVEYYGGGQWVTMWTGDLHGVPSNPPTIQTRVVKAADGSTEDLYLTPSSPVGETVSPFYRDGDLNTSPTYQLCVSAGDRTPRYVASGTEVGPADYFANIDGVTGSPSHVLSAIALTREQVKRVMLGVQGHDSGVQSWQPFSMSLLGQPWLESFDAQFDNASGNVLLRIKGGAHCASVFTELSTVSNFSAPITGSSALTDGGDVTITVSLSGAQRGKTWYARATPFNQSSLGGLSGVAQIAQVVVPALFTLSAAATENTNASTGTLTLTVADPGLVIDQTSKIKFYQTVNGVRSGPSVATSAPAGTTGDFVLTLTLDPKHNVKVEPIIYFADGSTSIIGAWTFDADKVANCLSAVPVNGKFSAVITAYFDTDTVVGGATARYRVDAGAWTTFAVASALTGSFTVNLTANRQTVDVQGKDADGNWGPSTTIQVAPALFTISPVATENTSASTGTLTLSVVDSGLVIDQTLKIKFYQTVNGVRTGPFVATSGPAGTTGDFVYTLTLDPKHNVKVEPIIYFADGSNSILGAWTFDTDKISDVINAAVATISGVATVTVVWDTDALVGSNCARYSLDGGFTWTSTVAISGSYLSQFSIAQISTKQSVIVQAKNAVDAGATYGNQATVEVDAFGPANAQGTVSIDSNGNWGAVIDGSSDALSFRWSSSTASFPVDATVASSGTLVTGTGRLLTVTGGPLTFGQTVYITVVPFTGTSASGTQLPAIHIRSSYQTTSGSRTSRYAGTAFFHGTSGNAQGFDRLNWAYAPLGKETSDGTGTPDTHYANLPVAQGMTLRVVRLRTGTSTTYNQVSLKLYRQDADGSSTQLGSTQTATNAGYSTLTINSLAESVTSSRSYLLECKTMKDITSIDGTTMLWFELDQDYPDLRSNL